MTRIIISLSGGYLLLSVKTFTCYIFFLSGFSFTYIQDSSLPLPPASQTVRHQPGNYCRELASVHSQLLDSNQKILVSERKSLTTKLRALDLAFLKNILFPFRHVLFRFFHLSFYFTSANQGQSFQKSINLSEKCECLPGMPYLQIKPNKILRY